MSNFLYVDNSNVWIEGMHVSAVAQGMAPTILYAQQNKVTDPTYRLDFGRLLQFAGGDRNEVGRAVLFGSRPPANDTLWSIAKSKGFEVIVHDRSAWTGKEKKVDTNIVTDIVTDSFTRMKAERDEITVVTGDSDFVPMLASLKDRKFRVDVCFWDHAARELRDAASKFVSLNPYLDHLRLK